MIERIKTLLPWVIIIVLMILYFFKGCGVSNTSYKTETIRDTIYKEKVIKIPEIKEVFVNSKPKVISVIPPKSDKDTAVSVYQNIYKDSSGLAQVEIIDSVKGRLTHQNVKFHVKEQEIKYTEKTITNTVKKKPVFILSAGLNTTIGVRPSIGAEVDLKNRTTTLELGINNYKEVTVGLKKDIFTKWGE